MRSEFPLTINQKLAERAGFFCSNPLCRKITIGPSPGLENKSIKIGIASHICAASPKGPRYDMSQSDAERSSINNGIWLCASCSVLIDKNGGYDFPAEHLRKWKKDHETLIHDCMMGNKRFVLQLLTSTSQTSQCRSVIKLLEQRGALFADYDMEVPYYVFDSIKEIRSALTAVQTQVDPESPLEIIIDSMSHAFRHFMNTTSPTVSQKELVYSLGALRKVIGINLQDLQKIYSTPVTGPLASILPTI
jgi:hypothetical protein